MIRRSAPVLDPPRGRARDPALASSLAATPDYREALQDLPAPVVQALMDCGSRHQWRRGQVVLAQGQPLDAVVVCLQGRMAVTLSDSAGHNTLLRWLSDGEMVGMPAVLAGTAFPVNIMAGGPASSLHVERKAFIDILLRHPEGAIGVARLLSHRLAELFRFVELTSNRSLEDRVRFALSRLARHHGTPGPKASTVMKITQAEMAMAAGASRQRVHLMLKRLQTERVVELGYGTITVWLDRL
jgi:CRP-like cAMP-binding protein